VEENDSDLNFKVLSQHLSGESVKNHENQQDGRSPGRDMIPRPPEYEEVLITPPRRSVNDGEEQ
jgi:hypothetical protein